MLCFFKILERVLNFCVGGEAPFHPSPLPPPPSENLAYNQVLMIMNFAIKFSLVGYRETQRKWFGIKGKSWHVSVAVKKHADAEVEVEF